MMFTNHAADALVLMATMLSSKRRPAELVEIVAAADLLQGHLPTADQLGAALHRLSANGLIAASEGGYTLTETSLAMMEKTPRRASTQEQLAVTQNHLAAHHPREEFPAIRLPRPELTAAIRTHKTAQRGATTNLLMPKAKPDRHFKVEGRWRRVAAKR